MKILPVKKTLPIVVTLSLLLGMGLLFWFGILPFDSFVTEKADAIQQLSVLRQSLMHGAIEAKAAGDHYAHATLSNAAVNAVRETARLTGELSGVHTITNVTNNTAILMASPVMMQLQNMLVSRLSPFPAALAAVMDGLMDLEATNMARQPAQVIDAHAV